MTKQLNDRKEEGETTNKKTWRGAATKAQRVVLLKDVGLM